MNTGHKPIRPFVPNRYLPKPFHRFCNALVAALVMLWLFIYVLPYQVALYAGAAVFVVVLCIDPSKLSFVEGIAGDDGYVDLDKEP